MLSRVAKALLLALCLCPFPALGQESQSPSLSLGTPGFLVSPILTIDQERLFEGSGVAAQIAAAVETRSRALADENRAIEADLEAEELDLTERRPSLTPDEFRALADAFDEKVQRLRTQQDRKQAQLQQLRDDGRQNFLRQVTPVIEAIVRERGALIVIDRRAAILSADAIDITDETIARIDASLSATSADPPAPQAPSANE